MLRLDARDPCRRSVARLGLDRIALRREAARQPLDRNDALERGDIVPHHVELEEEAVELRLRQRVRPLLLNGILSRKYKERFIELVVDTTKFTFSFVVV